VCGATRASSTLIARPACTRALNWGPFHWERLDDPLRRRSGAVEEPNDLSADAGRGRRDHDRGRHNGRDRDRHAPPVAPQGSRTSDDLGPAPVVARVREQAEAGGQVALEVDHRTAPSGSSTARSCARACARAAATVPSLTSHADAISAYEKSPK
jgi:hypothetical protein